MIKKVNGSLTLILVIMAVSISFLPSSFAAQYAATYGVVVDEEGVELSNVKVSVYNAGGTLIATTSTDSNGSFNMFVEYGTVSFYFTKTGYSKTVKNINVQDILTNLGTIVLSKALKLSASTLSLLAAPGDEISIPFTVSNLGEGSEVVQYQVSKPQTWSVSVMDQNYEVSKSALSPGQSLSLKLEVSVPLTAVLNLGYNISLTVIGTATNSSLVFTIVTRSIVLSKALKLSASTLSLLAAPGDEISIPFTVSNLGEGSEVVQYQVSKPQTWSVSVMDQNYEVSKSALSPGQSLSLKLEVSVPLTAVLNLGYNISLTVIGTATNSSLVFTIVTRSIPTITFSGRVLDEYGKRMEEVGIEVYSSDGVLIGSSDTSPNGAFSIELPTSTTVSVHFSREGYVEVAKNVVLKDVNVDVGEIVLAKAVKLSSSVLSVVASPGSKLLIPFMVSNIGGVSETIVFLVSNPGGWSTRILGQDDQEVLKAALASGQSLSLTLEVMVPSTALLDMDYNIPLTVIGTATNSSLVFTIVTRSQPAITFSGNVVDEYGKRMEEVGIEVYSSDGVLIGSSDTSPNGAFSIELPTSTTVSVHFSREGYVEVAKNVVLKDVNVDVGEIVLAKAVKLSSSVLSVVASPGSKLLIPFMVSNIGGVSETIVFLVSNPGGWSTRILGQDDQEVLKAALASGQSLSLTLEVMVPSTALLNYNLTLTAIGKINSSLDFMIKVQPSTKTVISCQFPGKSAAPGETVQFKVNVMNPTDVKQLFSVSVDSIQKDWIVSIMNTQGETVSEVTLEGSGSVDLVIAVSTPLSVSEGKYDLVFTAKSTWLSEDLPLLLVIQRHTASIGLEAIPPYEDVYGGSQAKFTLKLSDLGGYDELLNLTTVGLTKDFKVWFEDTTEQEITKVYVQASQSKQFYMIVSTPTKVELGPQAFSTSAFNAELNETIDLTLNIVGKYEVTITNQNFYTSLNVGSQGTFSLTILNDGSREITNAKVVAGTAPDGFTVSVNPTSTSSLETNQESTFTITAQTDPSVNAGNYYIDFTISSDQTTSQVVTLRVEVLQTTNWIIYAVILIILAVVGLFFIYRRFGRR